MARGWLNCVLSNADIDLIVGRVVFARTAGEDPPVKDLP